MVIEMVGASNGDNPGFSHHTLDYLVEAASGVGTLRRTHPLLGGFDGLPTTLSTGCADESIQTNSWSVLQVLHPRWSGDPKRHSSFAATIQFPKARGGFIVAQQPEQIDEMGCLYSY
jgi:hypothetical protein